MIRVIIVFIFSFGLHLACYSQISSNPHVKLIEQKNGKRLQLFAKNTDTIPYNIFLRLTTTDFRRTSKRPILKEIPGQSQVLLKTLILLDGKEGNYNPTFIVNEVTKNLSITKSIENFDIKINTAKKDTKILIFTDTNCELCEQAVTILENNVLNFKKINIIENSENLIHLEKELNDRNTLQNIEFPVVKIDDQLYSSIKTRQQFIDILKIHFR